MSSPTLDATKPSTPPDDLTVSPETRKAVKRTKEEILEDLAVDCVPAFSLTHPSLGPSFGDIAGPFDDSESAKDCCNEWSHKPTLQPLGTFRMRVGGARAPAPTRRGRMFKVACRSKGCKYGWWYEKASDNKFYCQRVLGLDHLPGCLKPNAKPEDKLAEGDFHIPQELMDLAKMVAPGCPGTAAINDILFAHAVKTNIPITWTWHHLDRALEKAAVSVGKHKCDAQGLVEWLAERKYMQGLYSALGTDTEGCLTRVFYEVDGAREHWDGTAGGARLTLFDTTHGTDAYGMKLGCFTAKDRNKRIILLAVSLIKREDAQSFEWVYNNFKKAFGSHPDVLLTDGDLAMAAACARVLPESRHLLCAWHIGQNLLTHALRLFPPRGTSPDMNAGPREKFMTAFRALLDFGGSGTMSADEYFDTKWAVVIDMAREAMVSNGIDANGHPSPVGVETAAAETAAAETATAEAVAATITAAEVAFNEACKSAEEELTAQPGELDEILVKRASEQRSKSGPQLVWEWLVLMQSMKKKWARVYTRESLTLDTFTTNIAEAWHSVLKRKMSGGKKLLVLVQLIELKRKMMEGRKSVAVAAKKREHEYKSSGYPALLETVREFVTTGAFTSLLSSWEEAQPFLAREVAREVEAGDDAAAGDGAARGDVVEDGRVGGGGGGGGGANDGHGGGGDDKDGGGGAGGVEPHKSHKSLRTFRVGTKTDMKKGNEDRPREVTLVSCSEGCQKNMGLPCAHMMRVYMCMNEEEFAEGVIHPFWMRGRGE